MTNRGSLPDLAGVDPRSRHAEVHRQATPNTNRDVRKRRNPKTGVTDDTSPMIHSDVVAISVLRGGERMDSHKNRTKGGQGWA